jgi:serine/threonine protein kinase
MNPSFAWGERLQLLERLKKLKNEAITPYLEMEFKDKELSIVMEIAKEGSLKKFLQKRGKLTEELASKMTEQIL